jgi:hypothetical protein
MVPSFIAEVYRERIGCKEGGLTLWEEEKKWSLV